MKKLLLISALALGALTASAQSFTDFYSVSYEGKAVENGGYIEASYWDAKAGWFPCDIEFTPKGTYSSVLFNVLGEYTGNPSYDVSSANLLEWGFPSICWEVGKSGNCEPNTPPIISNFTLGDADHSIDASLPIEVKFHLVGEENMEMPPNFNPNDPSTWPEPAIEPVNTNHFLLTMSATVDGKAATDTFSVNVIIGKDASGVEEIGAEFDAPAVYYDLQGRMVKNPAKGQLVIEKRGSKVKKVIK